MSHCGKKSVCVCVCVCVCELAQAITARVRSRSFAQRVISPATLQHSPMVWGRTKKNVRNGGWVDYSNGKGNCGNAAGGWGGQRAWENRGDSWVAITAVGQALVTLVGLCMPALSIVMSWRTYERGLVFQ